MRYISRYFLIFLDLITLMILGEDCQLSILHEVVFSNPLSLSLSFSVSLSIP
jgi:hypothetical protein